MRHQLRSRLTYANVMSTLAVFLVLGGGTALAAYVVSSNSQIGPNTVSGHKPPSGDHSNIIGGSVNSTDLANQAVTPAKLKPPEAWHNVGAGSTTQNQGEEVSEGRVDLQPDGLVVLVFDCGSNFADCSASGGYVTLEGISFRRDG
jgi:hypothetical protein